MTRPELLAPAGGDPLVRCARCDGIIMRVRAKGHGRLHRVAEAAQGFYGFRTGTPLCFDCTDVIGVATGLDPTYEVVGHA